jgi:hypothetical protein
MWGDEYHPHKNWAATPSRVRRFVGSGGQHIVMSCTDQHP